MDFARKQLEKYGWVEGKGLGKEENGVKNALKPKPKVGSSGVGYDIAEEFVNHWWQDVYNTAANNIEVNVKQNGEIQNFVVKNSNETKNNSKVSKRKKEEKSKYLNSFVKGATLVNGRNRDYEKCTEVESENLCSTVIPVCIDDELFAACEKRTAHKGARHGLKSNGKLLRIQKQEMLFLKKIKNKRNKPYLCFLFL